MESELVQIESETIQFESESNRIHGCLRQAPGNNRYAVIICHDYYDQQENWSDFAERLTGQGYTTLSFDFCGHGSSEGLKNNVLVKSWAYNIRDAMNFLGKMGYRHFGLVGLGSGATACLLTAAHDHRVECIVSMAAPVILIPPFIERIAFTLASLFSRLRKLFKKGTLRISRLGHSEKLILLGNEEENARYMTRPSIESALKEMPVPEGLDHVWVDITGVVSRIKAPVLILQGEMDNITPSGQARQLQRKLDSHKEMKFFEKSGHLLHLDQESDEVFKQTSRWFKKYLKEI